MVFAKLAFLNKLGKSLDFRDILGSPNNWKLVKISMQTCYWNAVWIFIKIWWFSPHFDLQSAPPKSLKYSLLELLISIWHRFGTARSNLDGFWLVWARFFTDFGSILAVFQMEWTYLLQTMAGWTISINCCTQHRNLLSHWLFSMTSGAAGCAQRIRRLPNGECTACWIEVHLLNIPNMNMT